MNKVKYFLWTAWCIIGAFLTPQWLTITFLNITGLIYKYDYTMDEGTAEILGIILLLMWVLMVLVPVVLFLKKMKYYGNKEKICVISGLLIAVLLGMAVFEWDTVGFWIN